MTDAVFGVNGVEFRRGDRVSLDVPWPDGRVTQTEGDLVTVVKENAYVETAVGAVVGPADSLEHVQRQRR